MAHSMPRGSAPRPNSRGQPRSALSAVLISGTAGIVLAAFLGLPSGYLIIRETEANCSPTEPFCELGAVVGGAAAGFIVSVLTYVVTATAVILRLRPKGKRAAEMAALLLAPFVLVTLIGLVLFA